MSAALGDWSPAPRDLDGLTAIASVDDGNWILHTGAGDRDFLPGVNLGPTIPGRQPGEQAIRREDFQRWFPQMHRLGMRAIRVYTIMPPSFYEELVAFNESHADSPLYLLHGVWIPEERFYQTHDLFTPDVVEEFHAEISRAVDVVHGDADLPERRGHASGTFTTDVSPWLASWIIGVEWDPVATANSDRANAGHPPFQGDFISATPDATPTESWIAAALDHLAALESARGVSVPLAFVNWPTTDPLDHPDEPLDREDAVGVDANRIVATDAWPAGLFASYHAYPYYPDFQRYEEGIAGFELSGQPDNYAGYLTKLRDHHAAADLPVMVTEFGVPSGMAHAHFGPQGRDQGGHSEQDQMEINADLMRVIHEVGLSGGLVFEWVDEWFKFTWNTIDFELPRDRRQLWVNPWTNEAHFGIVAVEPGVDQPVVLDGDDGEWTDNGSQVIYESREGIREVRALKDQGYLYLRLLSDVDDALSQQPIVIGLDVILGGAPMPDGTGWEQRADYALVIEGGEATIQVRGGNDPVLWQYGVGLDMIDYAPVDLEDTPESWAVQRLMVNRPLTNPNTGEMFDAEIIEPGRVKRGTTDPAHPEFDSRAVWQAAGNVVEVRLPYQAIGFSDPSSLQAYVMTIEGLIETAEVERVGIAVVSAGELHSTNGYAWEPWQSVEWHERVKAGTHVLSDTITEVVDQDSSTASSQSDQ